MQLEETMRNYCTRDYGIKRIYLSYNGKCVSCGTFLPRGVWAWWFPKFDGKRRTGKVLCEKCHKSN